MWGTTSSSGAEPFTHTHQQWHSSNSNSEFCIILEETRGQGDWTTTFQLVDSVSWDTGCTHHQLFLFSPLIRSEESPETHRESQWARQEQSRASRLRREQMSYGSFWSRALKPRVVTVGINVCFQGSCGPTVTRGETHYSQQHLGDAKRWHLQHHPSSNRLTLQGRVFKTQCCTQQNRNTVAQHRITGIRHNLKRRSFSVSLLKEGFLWRRWADGLHDPQMAGWTAGHLHSKEWGETQTDTHALSLPLSL